MTTEQRADRRGTAARRGATLLGLLAAVLLAHPLYLWPQLRSDPSALLLAGVVRPTLTLLGGFLLTYAGLVAYRDSWKPLTPLTAMLFPLTASIAVLGLQWYDEVVLELAGARSLDNNPVLLGALSLLFLVGGSLVRRERTRAVLAFLVGCLALFLLGVFLVRHGCPSHWSAVSPSGSLACSSVLSDTPSPRRRDECSGATALCSSHCPV